MSLADLLEGAEDELKGLRVSRAKLTASVAEGLRAASEEAAAIRGGAGAAKAAERIVAAFAAGLRRSLAGG